MKVLLTVSLVTFSATAAFACEFQRSVQATTDPTVVASVTTESATQMSTPVLPLPAPEETATPAPEQN
jgi:hypothetical protein